MIRSSIAWELLAKFAPKLLVLARGMDPFLFANDTLEPGGIFYLGKALVDVAIYLCCAKVKCVKPLPAGLAFAACVTTVFFEWGVPRPRSYFLDELLTWLNALDAILPFAVVPLFRISAVDVGVYSPRPFVDDFLDFYFATCVVATLVAVTYFSVDILFVWLFNYFFCDDPDIVPDVNLPFKG